jgi:peptidyl-prolyl cis-trans isomerase A (cyclophilin A)
MSEVGPPAAAEIFNSRASACSATHFAPSGATLTTGGIPILAASAMAARGALTALLAAALAAPADALAAPADALAAPADALAAPADALAAPADALSSNCTSHPAR